jgi:glucosamine 6-phosphate synthetase-like amidotransferase/phosphosugar isomerase protein
MTTQGNAKKNRNNHPFVGRIGKEDFALAHNGVLYNDMTLKRTQHLPKTNIETDSYVAVQLLEKENALDFSSLQVMAERVQGSFVFTVLDGADNLYFVKGDNPLCLAHYPQLELYVYASTPQILAAAVNRIPLLSQGSPVEVDSICGDILCIDRSGAVTREAFDTRHLWSNWYTYSTPFSPATHRKKHPTIFDTLYWDELKSIAGAYGYTPETIDEFRELGFTTDEIEEMIYFGEI